jgi:AraC-like DNA-binding protein
MAERMFVSTMLTVPERYRVDAVGADAYDLVHRDTIDEVLRDVRDQRARAIVLSVARCERPEVARIECRVAGIVRDYPRVTAVALLSEFTGEAPSTMLLLGRCGIRTIVDARRPEGWRVLRDALAARRVTGDITSCALAQLMGDLGSAPPDCRQFFVPLFNSGEPVTTVAQLARTLAVLPSTLISRFCRARLPSPKTYLSWARLIRAAALLENPGVSASAVATALEYSSPQGFSRHVRLRLNLTLTAFRRHYTGAGMFARFRQELVLDHLSKLMRFRPLTGDQGPGTSSQEQTPVPGLSVSDAGLSVSP